MKRFKTKHPGVFYREADRIGGRGKEKVFYVVFKKEGKVYEEKVGRQYADNMTEAKAARIRSDRIEGKRQSRKEIREQRKQIIWTIEKLWEAYKESHPDLKSLPQEESKFRVHLSPLLGKKEPSKIVPLDIDRLRIKILKTKKPATARNVLELLRRIINFGQNKKITPPLGFKIEMPKVDNLKTEDLNDQQMEKLMTILQTGIIVEKDGTQTAVDGEARDAMLLALVSGMRRGEIFGLAWKDVDFRRGFITIRNPKGGREQTIPLSDSAREILERRPKDTPFVFPATREGKKKTPHRVDMAKELRAIRNAAGLPADFRPMHGLRHAFASRLASSGQVDLYTIQRLLTHKSPITSARYAHLRDETLRNAANLAGSVTKQVFEKEDASQQA